MFDNLKQNLVAAIGAAILTFTAVGAVDRGMHYLERFPGYGGWMLFAACTGAVFMAGAKLLDLTRSDNGERRRKSDLIAQP